MKFAVAFCCLLLLNFCTANPLQLLQFSIEQAVKLKVKYNLMRNNVEIPNSLSKILSVRANLLDLQKLAKGIKKLLASSDIELHHDAVMTRLDEIEKFLRASFRSLMDEFMTKSLSDTLNEQQSFFDEFETLFIPIAHNETAIAERLRSFIRRYEERNFEFSIVNHLTGRGNSLLSYIWKNTMEDVQDVFNKKRTSPSQIITDLWLSMNEKIIKGGVYLTYAYNMLEQISQINSTLDLENVKVRADEAVGKMRTGFLKILPLAKQNFLSTYINVLEDDETIFLDHICGFWIWSCQYRYIYTNKIVAERKGYVVVGTGLRMRWNTLYLQLQVGELLPTGIINETSIYWQAPPNDLDKYRRNADDIEFFELADLHFEDAIMTGVQFYFAGPTTVSLKIHGRQFKNMVLGEETDCASREVLQIKRVTFEETSLNQTLWRTIVTGNAVDLSFMFFFGTREGSRDDAKSYVITKSAFVETRRILGIGNPVRLEFIRDAAMMDVPVPLSGMGMFHYTNSELYQGYIRPYFNTVHFKKYL